MRNQKRLWWIVFLCSVFVALIWVGWWASLPKYEVFITPTIGPEHTALQIVFPDSWRAWAVTVPSSAPDAVQDVMLNPRASHDLRVWVETHVLRLRPDALQRWDIDIMLKPESGVRDLNQEARNIRTGFGRTAVAGVVHQSDCALGPMLWCDISETNTSMQIDTRRIRVFPAAMANAPRYSISVDCYGSGDSKDLAFRAAAVIVTHSTLIHRQSTK